MSEQLINKNFDYFQKQLPKLMEKHLDKIAVVKDQKIVQIFDNPKEANEFVIQNKYSTGTFLIQEINDQIHYVSRLV